MSQKPFFPSVVVWGSAFVHKFLHYALPTCISPNNLPAVAGKRPCEFVLISTQEDFHAIEQSAVFQELRKLLPVKFVPVDFASMKTTPHLKMSHGHRIVSEYASARNGYCIFLGPDYLLADGSIRFLHERAVTNSTRAVVLPGFRLVEEELPIFITEHIKPGDRAISISPREMVSMILKHVHGEMQSYMVDRDRFTATPNYLIWPMRDQNCLVVRALHLHPLMVDMEGAADFASLSTDTIDGDFLGHLIGNWDSIEVVQDSDNACVVSLTPRNQGLGVSRRNRADPEKVRSWFYSPIVTPLHRHFLTQPIIMHARGIPQQAASVVEESGRFVYRALDTRSAQMGNSKAPSLRAIASIAWASGKARIARYAGIARAVALGGPRALRAFIRYGSSVQILEAQITRLLEENNRLRELIATTRDKPSQNP